jgi:hypothetical protein
VHAIWTSNILLGTSWMPMITCAACCRCNQGKVNFREKEKQVLDQILGPGRYDARIRPSGINGTGEGHAGWVRTHKHTQRRYQATVKPFFNFPLYLQSVPTHSANVLRPCRKARRRVLTSTLLYLIGSESSCDLGSETYKLNLRNYIYNYSICILNLASIPDVLTRG